jgi:sentrin-specific protease 1
MNCIFILSFTSQVINDFGDLVGKESDGKAKIFSSFFMERLLDEADSKSFTFKNVERYTKNDNLFALEKIAIPVNIGSIHWVLLTADLVECEILMHDSLSLDGSDRYPEAFLRYLKEEAIAKTGCSLNELTGGKDWRLGQASCSQQGNSFDCGVFTCIFMECFILGIPVYIDASNAEQCREKIGTDILRGKIII